jgi:hypothetical protein
MRVNVGLDIVGGPARCASTACARPPRGSSSTPPTRRASRPSRPTRCTGPAAYAELELTPMPGLRLIPSLRVDYARDANRSGTCSRASPSAGSSCDDWFIKGGVGVFSQAAAEPADLERAQHLPCPAPPWATPSSPAALDPLRPRLRARLLAVRHRLSMEGFYKDLDARWSRRPSITGTGVPQQRRGAHLRRGDPPAAPALVALLRLARVHHLPQRAARRAGPGLPHLPVRPDAHPHGHRELPPRPRVGDRRALPLRHRQPHHPRRGRIFNADSGHVHPGPRAAPFSARNDPFHQLDVRIDKTWTLGARGTFNLYLEVLNVYNNTNPEGVSVQLQLHPVQRGDGDPHLPQPRRARGVLT